jgi:hypothetical protein
VPTNEQGTTFACAGSTAADSGVRSCHPTGLHLPVVLSPLAERSRYTRSRDERGCCAARRRALPVAVLDLLARVRATGRTNMLVLHSVLTVASELLEEPEDYDAWLWLVDHRRRYVEAVAVMGDRRPPAHRMA